MIAKNIRVLPYNDKLVGSKRTDLSISDNDRGENAIMVEGRISDEEIQKVREASDLVALMGERSPMRQKGRDFWCCCPIHNEKTPSCKVDPSTQLWHCFGCGEGGDIFGFLMKVDGMSFPEAVQFLADKAHITLTRSGKDDGGASNSKKARLKQVCAETADFYHFQLMRVKNAPTDAARAYLAGRNLGGAIPREWMLGFAPGSGTLVRHLSSKGFTPDEMVEANVALRGDNGRVRDRFYNRIMFPIRDVQGDCIAFGGRIIGDGQPKYLNSQETPLFHKSTVLYGLDKAKTAMAATGDAIVVEGYTDVIALHRAGVDNAVATLGTALTRQHIRTLSRHAKNRIIYLFDGDEAGQRAADRALQFIDSSITPEAGRTRIDLCAVTLPDNLDPADFVLHIFLFARLQHADIDDHIDLVRAVFYGVRRLKALGLRGVVAVREADDGADCELVAHVILGLLDIGGRNTDGGRLVFHAVVADRLDLGPGRRLRQQRMVDLTEDLFQFHGVVPPFYVL